MSKQAWPDDASLLAEMLDAARSEQSSAAALEGSRLAALSALSGPTLPHGSATGVKGGGSAAVGAPSSTLTLVAPALGLGFVGSTALLLLSTALSPAPSPRTADQRSPSVASASSATASPTPPHEQPPAPAGVGSSAAPARTSPLRPAPASEPRGPQHPEDELRLEIELVQSAQRALVDARPLVALRTLDRYAAVVQRKRLLQEAWYLRMQALVALGSQAEAEVVAQQLLQRFPDGPHAGAARRVRHLPEP